MRVVVSEAAADLIAERGGRLYVWQKRARCCGAVTTLVSASEPPAGKDFKRVAALDRFALYMPARLSQLPEEIQLEARRFPRRVEAYWNGCAWVA
jgi:hypothetical protein